MGYGGSKVDETSFLSAQPFRCSQFSSLSQRRFLSHETSDCMQTVVSEGIGTEMVLLECMD